MEMGEKFYLGQDKKHATVRFQGKGGGGWGVRNDPKKGSSPCRSLSVAGGDVGAGALGFPLCPGEGGLRDDTKTAAREISIYVGVQFYPWFNFYFEFPLFLYINNP